MAPSRVPWERIEPIAELFADLDPKIDAREDDFQAGVDDPEFTGYHRIEQRALRGRHDRRARPS